MSTSKMWVVEGDCGAYSDHTQWAVCAFVDEKDANAYARLCEEGARDAVKRKGSGWNVQMGDNQYDPQGLCDSDGTRYTVYMLEVHNSIPVL